MSIPSEAWENHPVIDTFSTGLARIERLGSCRRLVFYTTQISSNGETEYLVVAKLVLAADVVIEIAPQLFQEHQEKEPAIDPALTAFQRASAH